jgi:hypothetical protein
LDELELVLQDEYWEDLQGGQNGEAETHRVDVDDELSDFG